MLTRIDLRDTDPDARDLAAILPRADLDVAAALEAVAPLIEDVRTRGAAALRDAAERFDHVRPEHLRVPASAIERALADLDAAVREGLELSIAHNRAGHAAQLPVERVTEVVPGGRVVQRWIPVRRVGLYAPGGLAVYPSSVVMNVVPAQVAGVERIALASPPQAAFGGLPHPTILAACGLLGVEEVYAVGGAQAIAMFAYGAADDDGAPTAGRLADAAGPTRPAGPAPAGAGGGVLCERVDVVAGPGNVYVAAAKRAVRGAVGIDAEAGPTEIAVLADAVVVDFGVSQEAVWDLVRGAFEPSGLLPVRLPASMEAVERHCEDLPFDYEPYTDSAGRRYDFGYGLSWAGVIEDERTRRYTAPGGARVGPPAARR